MDFAPRRWRFYRIVDKIVRIYRVIGDSKNVRIRLSGGSHSDALVDLRTVHIVPSVFIDNAVKYSQMGETVDVRVSDETLDQKSVIALRVTSNGPPATQDEERDLFIRRARGHAARAIAEGSGVGLTST